MNNTRKLVRISNEEARKVNRKETEQGMSNEDKPPLYLN
jgi:hypothetical protein